MPPVVWYRLPPVAGKPRTRALSARRKERARRYRADTMQDVRCAVLEATKARGDLVIAPTLSTAELLEWALRRVHAAMLWAGQQADGVHPDDYWVEYLDPVGNTRVEPNKWAQLERSLRQEAVTLAARMQDLGLAERAVQLEEAKAIQVVGAMRAACEAAGVPPEQVVEVGVQLRRLLEAGVVEEPVAA